MATPSQPARAGQSTQPAQPTKASQNETVTQNVTNAPAGNGDQDQASTGNPAVQVIPPRKRRQRKTRNYVASANIVVKASNLRDMITRLNSPSIKAMGLEFELLGIGVDDKPVPQEVIDQMQEAVKEADKY